MPLDYVPSWVSKIMARKKKRKSLTQFSEAEAYHFLQISELHPWEIIVEPRVPSKIFPDIVKRLEVIALEYSEAGREVLIDTILQEALLGHNKLRIWKEVQLQTPELTGRIEYLCAERIAYLQTPFVCLIEAKKDNFERGRIQCLLAMKACQILNKQEGYLIDIYGIVSNGFNWRFYQLLKNNVIFQSQFYSFPLQDNLVLGMLEYIFAACEINLPTGRKII